MLFNEENIDDRILAEASRMGELIDHNPTTNKKPETKQNVDNKLGEQNDLTKKLDVKLETLSEFVVRNNPSIS